MNLNRRCSLLCIVLHILVSDAIASPQPAESLEWQVADSDLIVRGIVSDVVQERVAEDTIWQTITIRVVETIKGPKLDQVSFPDFRFPRLDLQEPWEGPRREILVLLVRTDRPENREPPFAYARHPRARAFSYVLRGPWDAIPLEMQETRRFIRMTWGVIRTSEQLLMAIRSAAREERLGGAPSSFQIYHPRQGTEVSPLDVSALIVPIDHRLEAMARQWIRDANERRRVLGATALAHFRSRTNEALLIGLLDDPYSVARRASPWSPRRYPVRQAAHDALTAWGTPVPPTVLTEPSPYYRSLWPALLMVLAALPACLLTTGVLRGWNRRARWGWPSVRTVAITCGFATTGLLLLLWWRSERVLDVVVFTAGRTAHKLVSDRGKLQYMIISDWSLPMSPVHGAFRFASIDGSDHGYIVYHGSWTAPVARQWGDFWWMRGEIQEGENFRQKRPYRALSLPHWFAASLPAIVVLPALRRSVRITRRKRAGLCPKCGYDLRASSLRCPECGEPFGR